MYPFLNTVELIPPAQEQFIVDLLRDENLAVPVVLKAMPGRPGYVALIAWIPGREPIVETVSAEEAVCSGHRVDLEQIIDRLAARVREVRPSAAASSTRF